MRSGPIFLHNPLWKLGVLGGKRGLAHATPRRQNRLLIVSDLRLSMLGTFPVAHAGNNMHLHLLTLGSFVFFTGLVAVITWWLTRGDRHDTSAGYFLAGRTLTGGYIAGSLMLTNLSTEQLVGLNADAFNDGLCVMAWEVIAAMSLVLMALYFLPKYLKAGIATVPEFLEQRYNESTRTITTLIFIIAYAVILLPIILYTGATGLASILNLQELLGIESETTILWLMVWLIGIIGSIYAIFGGLRTVAVSDTINGFGLLTGGLLIAWLGLSAISPDAPLSAFSKMQEAQPEKFNSLGGPHQSVPFTTLFTGVLLLNLFYWCTNQQIIQRTFGASTLAEGQKGVLLAGMFKILAPLILVLPGIIAFFVFGRILADGQTLVVKDVTRGETSAVVLTIDAGTKDEHEEIVHGQEALKRLNVKNFTEVREKEGQSYHDNMENHEIRIDKIVPPKVVIAAPKNGENQYLPAEKFETVIAPPPTGDDAEEAKLSQVIGPPERVKKAYGLLVKRVLPKPLIGFFAAVMVGAILSSFNSALNSTATLFSLGVYQHLIHPEANEEQVIRSGKWFGWIIAIASMCIAPLLVGQDSIFGYLQVMNGLYFIPIFAVVVMGLLNRRVPPQAANVALVAGFTTIALGYFVPLFKGWVEIIHQFHFLGAVFASLVLLMLVWAKLSPLEEPWVQKSSGAVDLTPWKPAKIFGLVLVLIVLSIYVKFADFSIVSFP